MPAKMSKLRRRLLQPSSQSTFSVDWLRDLASAGAGIGAKVQQLVQALMEDKKAVTK
jgi:hypothetical protein